MNIVEIKYIFKLFNQTVIEFEKDIKILEKLIKKHGILEYHNKCKN